MVDFIIYYLRLAIRCLRRFVYRSQQKLLEEGKENG